MIKKGAPLYVEVSAANIHDSQLLKPFINCLPKSKSLKVLPADSAFDVKSLYELCQKKNILLDAATNVRRNKNKQKYKPDHRWIVERTLGWLSWYKGLKICWAKSKRSYLAFLAFACFI